MEIPYVGIGPQLAASVYLHLRFLKTDQTGHKRIVPHESTGDSSTCVVHRLEEYIRVSRDYFHANVNSVLFSVPGLPTNLSTAVLTVVMRDPTTAQNKILPQNSLMHPHLQMKLGHKTGHPPSASQLPNHASPARRDKSSKGSWWTVRHDQTCKCHENNQQ